MTKRRAERREERESRDFVLLSNLRYLSLYAERHGDELLARTVADAAARIEALTASRARVIDELKTTKWTLRRIAHGLDQQTRAFAGWVLDVTGRG